MNAGTFLVIVSIFLAFLIRLWAAYEEPRKKEEVDE